MTSLARRWLILRVCVNAVTICSQQGYLQRCKHARLCQVLCPLDCTASGLVCMVADIADLLATATSVVFASGSATAEKGNNVVWHPGSARALVARPGVDCEPFVSENTVISGSVGYA